MFIDLKKIIKYSNFLYKIKKDEHIRLEDNSKVIFWCKSSISYTSALLIKAVLSYKDR